MRFASRCLLCELELEPIVEGPLAGYQTHPVSQFCLVRFTDNWGIAVDDPIPAELDDSLRPDSIEMDIKLFPFVDEVLKTIFEKRNLPRLGGQSTGKGWSSFALWQRCPFAWKRRYLDNARPREIIAIESPALAIGTIIHTFLAIYYTNIIDPTYPLTVEECRRELLAEADPKFVNEGYHVFYAYVLHYQNEVIVPLAIELDLKHPRTRESCRFDLIAFFPETIGPWVAGTYIIEHKSSGRFDNDTLEGWANDGEVLGQVMLWQELGLDKRYGPLKGVIVNLLGKQKEAQFHRTLVAPQSWQMNGHKEDLRKWDGLIQLAKSSNSFPRARNNCINRYGRCGHWTECATEEH